MSYITKRAYIASNLPSMDTVYRVEIHEGEPAEGFGRTAENAPEAAQTLGMMNNVTIVEPFVTDDHAELEASIMANRYQTVAPEGFGLVYA